MPAFWAILRLGGLTIVFSWFFSSFFRKKSTLKVPFLLLLSWIYSFILEINFLSERGKWDVKKSCFLHYLQKIRIFSGPLRGVAIGLTKEVVGFSEKIARLRCYLKRYRQIWLKFTSLFLKFDVSSLETKISSHY